MTRRALAAFAVATALAGCTATDDSYGIDAFAELSPLAPAGPRITGRLEVLSAGARNDNVDFDRTIAAHRVDLPAGTSPWIRLWIVSSCVTQGGSPVLYQDLGLLRQVGDDVHFFKRGVVIAGRTVDLDIGTTSARVTLGSDPFGGPESRRLFDMVAVAQDPVDGGETTTEIVTGLAVPVGGAWLACGSFVPAPAPAP